MNFRWKKMWLNSNERARKWIEELVARVIFFSLELNYPGHGDRHLPLVCFWPVRGDAREQGERWRQFEVFTLADKANTFMYWRKSHRNPTVCTSEAVSHGLIGGLPFSSPHMGRRKDFLVAKKKKNPGLSSITIDKIKTPPPQPFSIMLHMAISWVGKHPILLFFKVIYS